jgi:hypothetical protein
MKNICLIILSFILCNCDSFFIKTEQNIIGYVSCWDNFSFGVVDKGKLIFYEWDSEQNQWKEKPNYSLKLPIGCNSVFSYGHDKLGILMRDKIKFYEYKENKWEKLFLRKERGKDKGNIISSYDFNIPKGYEKIFSWYYQIWIRSDTEINVLNYDRGSAYSNDAIDSILIPKWEPYITTFRDGNVRTFYDIRIFQDCNGLIRWDDGNVGAMKNNVLDFYQAKEIDDPAYFKTFNVINGSRFIPPEEYIYIFGAGNDSIGVVTLDKKIKFYSSIVQKDGYGQIINWYGWEYLADMDFDFS